MILDADLATKNRPKACIFDPIPTLPASFWWDNLGVSRGHGDVTERCRENSERILRDTMQKSTTTNCPPHRCLIGVGLASCLAFSLAACGNHRPSGVTPPIQCVNQLSDGTCPPTDPGSRPMTQKDCDDAEAGLEFLPLPIWDMRVPFGSSSGPIALGMYSYDDNTTPFRVPGKIWEPTTEPVARCGESPNDVNGHYALHMYGGPFMEWGGGVGRMLKCMNTDNSSTPWLPELKLNKYLCAARQSRTAYFKDDQSLAACTTIDKTPEADLMRSVCPQRDKDYAKNKTTDDEPYMLGMAIDLREWEGISLWARRSPSSQEGLRIAVADKYVDDDMMYLSQKYDPNRPRYCERESTCACNNNKPCTPLNVDYMLFDIDGNRLKYANDPHVGATPANPCPKVVAVDANGRTLINLSGEVVKDENGKTRTFPDGSTVSPYNGCPQTDKDSNGNPVTTSGQPFQTDVRGPQTYGFCFDPAIDPTPPDGLPAELINHRSYQKPQDPTATVNNYSICGGDLFTPAKPADEWIRFFCNTNEVPGYNYTVCGDNVCNLEYSSLQAVDTKYFGSTCSPYSFVGSITRNYCYKPGVGPNPAEGTQQCGDFWMKPVNLSTDWTLIKVPFSSLLQQGWAKRQYQLDLSSLTNVRIQWDRGWMDYWISDVRFYRTKKQ